MNEKKKKLIHKKHVSLKSDTNIDQNLEKYSKYSVRKTE